MTTNLVLNVSTSNMTTETYVLDEVSLTDKKLRLEFELKNSVSRLLAPTDYIVVKIQEAEILNQETAALIASYSTELTYRQNTRSWNATQEAAIASATTIEELNAIDVTSGPQS